MIKSLAEFIAVPLNHTHEIYKIDFINWIVELVNLIKELNKIEEYKIYISPNNLFETLYRLAMKEKGVLTYSDEETRIAKLKEHYIREFGILHNENSLLKTNFEKVENN